MNFKAMAPIGLTALLVATSQVASAASFVINFEGTIDEFNRPASLSNLDSFVLGDQGAYAGTIKVDNVENFLTFLGDAEPDTEGFQPFPGVFGTNNETITFDGMDGGSFVLTNPTIGGLEGARVFAPNPEFDPSLLPCSGFEISLGANGCGGPGVVENSPYVVLVSPTGEELRGDAVLEIVDGLPDTFDYQGGRDGLLETFDFVIEILEGQSANLDDLFQIDAVSLALSDFNFLNQEGDTFFFEVGTQFASLTVSEVAPVPVPGAVWLFGSALAGFFGIGKRKAANKS
ncbi:MAG: hypothetical protein AAF387_21260 [Pseudomonadota bacterium]